MMEAVVPMMLAYRAAPHSMDSRVATTSEVRTGFCGPYVTDSMWEATHQKDHRYCVYTSAVVRLFSATQLSGAHSPLTNSVHRATKK